MKRKVSFQKILYIIYLHNNNFHHHHFNFGWLSRQYSKNSSAATDIYSSFDDAGDMTFFHNNSHEKSTRNGNIESCLFICFSKYQSRFSAALVSPHHRNHPHFSAAGNLSLCRVDDQR